MKRNEQGRRNLGGPRGAQTEIPQPCGQGFLKWGVLL